MNRASEIGDAVVSHIDDAELLAYLDGELEPKDASRVKTHLERCWTCRSRVTALQASIDAFLRMRQAILPDRLMPSGAALATFRRRLQAQLAEFARPSPSWRLRRGFSRVIADWSTAAPRPVVAGLVGLLVAALVVGTWFSVPVSAADVLARAAEREVGDRAEKDRVTRSIAVLERVHAGGRAVRLATIELAADSQTPARYVSVRPTTGAEADALLLGDVDAGNRRLLSSAFSPRLVAYFDRQAWVPSLSVAEYGRLIAGRGTRHATGRRAWGNLFQLRHLFAPDHPSQLTETRIWIDRSTYLPTRISLFTNDRGEEIEYRLTQTSFELVSRTSAWMRLFARPEPEAPPRSAASSHAVTPIVPPPAVPLSWSDIPAGEAEVDAIVKLHLVEADLSEEINVFPMSDHSAFVQGLVETDARRNEIEAALAGLGNEVAVEILLPRDLAAGRTLRRAPWMSATKALAVMTADKATSENRRPLVYDAIAGHVRRILSDGQQSIGVAALERAVAELSTAIVQQSDRLFFHAWALQRLDVQFGPPRGNALSLEARTEVERLRRQHRRRIAAAADALRAQLAEVLDAERRAESGSTGTATLAPFGAAQIVTLASEQHALVRALFGRSSVRSGARLALSRLMDVLGRLGDA